jgi:predicted membrane protein
MNGHYRGRIFAGLLLIIIGGLFLLQQMDRLDFGDVVSRYWPVIFIILGVSILINSGFQSAGPAFFFIVFGTVFLLFRLDILEHSFWHYFWPVLIIAIGIWIIVKPSVARPYRTSSGSVSQDILDVTSVFAGSVRKVESQSLKGGKATAVFGSLQLDFSAAAMASNQAIVEMTAIFGSVEAKIPRSWKVIFEGTPVLGAMEDKRKPGPETETKGTLTIKGSAVFGAIEIKD